MQYPCERARGHRLGDHHGRRDAGVRCQPHPPRDDAAVIRPDLAASIDTQFQPIPVSFIRTSLRDRAGVVAWTSGNFGTIDVMDSHIPAIGLSRGGGPLVGPTLVTGRLPTRPDEIALGVSVLRSVNGKSGRT